MGQGLNTTYRSSMRVMCEKATRRHTYGRAEPRHGVTNKGTRATAVRYKALITKLSVVAYGARHTAHLVHATLTYL